MMRNLDKFEETPKKKPLDRKIVAKELRKVQIAEVILIAILLVPFVVFGLVLLLANVVLFDVLAVFLFVFSALVLLSSLSQLLILLPMGKFTVCYDAMCRKERVHRRHGGTTLYMYFSHHGAVSPPASLYHSTEPGDMFYVVSYCGYKWMPSMIFPTNMYEWVGPAEDVGGVSTASVPSDRMSNETILTRRPLTKGRKTKLTGEEIARDMVEDVRVSNGKLGLAAFGVVVLGCLLFTIEATVATVFLTVALPVCAAIGLQRAIWCAKVKNHRFEIEKDTLMDKDPLNRGFWRWKKMRFVLTFRNSGEYMLPLRDSSVYYDAELGDTFYIVRFAGKKKTVRAVYNALDVEVENDDQ